MRATHESFSQHLQVLESIDPKSWNPAELHKELSRALSAVDDSRAEFSQQRSRLQASEETAGDVALPEIAPEVSTLNGRSFGQWMQIGFAFTLPLIVFSIIALLIVFWMTGKSP